MHWNLSSTPLGSLAHLALLLLNLDGNDFSSNPSCDPDTWDPDPYSDLTLCLAYWTYSPLICLCIFDVLLSPTPRL